MPQARQKDKFIALPEERLRTDKVQSSPGLPANIVEELEPSRGRVTVVCVAEALDRKKLEDILLTKYGSHFVHLYPEAVHLDVAAAEARGDIFFFDCGVVVFWGLAAAQELSLRRAVLPGCTVGQLAPAAVEVEQLGVVASSTLPPHIQNDTIVMDQRAASDHSIKLAMAFALAQSVKLSVYESRVMDMVLATKALPAELAERGDVALTAEEVAGLMGKLFVLRGDATLAGAIGGTPAFFLHAPDLLKVLYGRMVEYVELRQRGELCSMRLVVLWSMLELLRDQAATRHHTRLELIVITVIAVQLLVGVLDVLGLFGVFGH